MMFSFIPEPENTDFIKCKNGLDEKINVESLFLKHARDPNELTKHKVIVDAGVWNPNVTDPKDAGSACFGTSIILRMTFSLFCFHAGILLIILPSGDSAAVIHSGGWALKFIIIFTTFMLFFGAPISFFSVWADISKYFGLIFMLLQVFYILAGAYAINEWFIKNGFIEKMRCSFWFIKILTLFVTGMGIAFIWSSLS